GRRPGLGASFARSIAGAGQPGAYPCAFPTILVGTHRQCLRADHPRSCTMKILYHFRTQGTGAEGVHIAGIANAFVQLGHAVVFTSPTGIDPRTTAGADPFGSRQRRSLLARLASRAPGFIFELLELAYNFV